MTESMISLFKGFVVTKDKKCIEKFKNRTDFKTYDEVKSLPEFAGILADDVVLIDIDDSKMAEMAMNIVEDKQLNCLVNQTTRGKHFFFKDSKKMIQHCYTHTALACGLTADIKIGRHNSYALVKYNGKERFAEWDVEECAVYQEIPSFFYPIKGEQPFIHMKAGDGRNTALFTYILTLQSNDFSVEQARECIQVINDFVLSEPLTQNELDVVLRDDAFKKPVFFKSNCFLHDRFATFIKNNNHIIRINGQLHIYKNGIYISGRNEIESAMIQHIPSLSRTKRTEVFEYLKILIMTNTPMASPNLIAFRNGVYNIETGELKPFDHNIVITNMIPWDYNPNAYSELADKTLDKIACYDKQIRTILEECIGSCFYRSNTLGGGKAFILTGEGSNGKSTFLKMLQFMLGRNNISSLDLKDLSAKFQNAELFGKLANIGDDISDEFIVDISVFKKLVTGDRIQVQRKGQDPFEFDNYAKMLFSANEIPRIKDKTGAVLRRLLIVPFDAKFSVEDDDYDENITFKLLSQEVMEYLIQIGLSAIKAVLQNHQFTESERIKAELLEYEESNNPLKAFLNECEDEEYTVENQPISEVFEKYSSFCLVNGYQSVSRTAFTRRMKKALDLETKVVMFSGKSVRIFIKGGEKNE